MLINSGNFSENGNFSGYNVKGDRIHIFARQMKALGIATDEDFAKAGSIYVRAVEKVYGAKTAVGADGKPVLNADGTPKLIPYRDGSFSMKRLTATALFKTEEDYIKAMASDATTDAKVKHRIAQEYAAIGLTPDAVEELESIIG